MELKINVLPCVCTCACGCVWSGVFVGVKRVKEEDKLFPRVGQRQTSVGLEGETFGEFKCWCDFEPVLRQRMTLSDL